MRLRQTLALVALAATAFVAESAAAERPAPAPQPYAPVTVVLPGASADASLIAFRAELAAVAGGRIYARLAPLVRTQGFFWDRDFGHGFDPRRPAVDNLAAAIRLEHDDGAGWDALAAFAAEASAEPLASRPGIVCAPASPVYDGVAFTRLLDATYTRPVDWAYPRAAETPLRAAPQPQAAVLGRLGLHFIRLLGFVEQDGEPVPGRGPWARVAAPDGMAGFVAPLSLLSLSGERLCYIKDLIGAWRIAGYVAGGPRRAGRNTDAIVPLVPTR
jgi:hypothetical protein